MNKGINFLEKSILATLVYYDILDYPLAKFEIWKYLVNPLHVMAQLGNISDIELEPMPGVSVADISVTLNSRKLKEFIEEKNGFYFLKGRETLYKKRIERHKIADERWKKAHKVVKILQVCPFVKMIAVCNSLAINNSKKDADIDFFIVVAKNRIWLTRVLVTFLVWVIGQWRHKDKITAKICLSFYITEDALNLRSVAIQPYDIYLANWIYQLRPIYYHGKIYEKFILNNQWVKDYLLNFGDVLNYRHPEFKKSRIFSLLRKTQEKILKTWIGGIIEKVFRFFQKIKISKKLTHHDISTAVIVSDKILKFHENDKREYFQRVFSDKLKQVLFS